MELVSNYDWLLVAVSVIAASISSFVSLSVVPRIYDASNNHRSFLWISAFGMSLGAGIWTMHFIGMLAFHLPVPVHYDLNLTIISLLLAIIVSAIAIAPLRSGGSLNVLSPKTLFVGTMMGFGVAGMHYTGMAAMRLDATMHHNALIVALAIAIAIVTSTAALLIANQLRDVRIFNQLSIKSLAAVVMGLAVSSMHYTAMAGMTFHPIDKKNIYQEAIDPIVLVIFVVIVAFLVQGGTIITALMDEAYSASRRSEAILKRRADINQALSDILAVALENLSLNEILHRVLDRLLDIEWLSFEQKGCIFLADSRNKTLHMVAERNLGPELQSTCAQLQFGRCLCGKAAESGTPIMKDCMDEEHTIQPAGMLEHGHCCIPVLAAGNVIGVINLYVQHDQKQSEDTVAFLVSVADAVSSIIQNKQLEEQALKIFSAIDQAGEAVLIADYEGVIEYVNQAFCQHTGYSKNEAIGQQPSILKSGHQDNDFYKQMWDTIKSGETWQGEVTERRKDGTTYPAMLTISPIRNNAGEITHFVGIHEDLSEHKNLEAQFRQAQKMEALGTLVGGIAHDFNNMLAGMLGNMFLIKKKTHGMPEVTEKIERVEHVGFQAADMIKQMLVFARSEEVEMSAISFTSFIREILKLHQVVIPDNVRLEIEIVNQPMKIHGNPTQLQQVLLNLFGNASDAVKCAESPVISVHLDEIDVNAEFCATRPDATEGKYAHLSVADNGCGINEIDVDRIFDPFFTTKEVGKGTGLGLAMSATIVKSHKGLIEVDSSPGKGSCFHIYLPLIMATANPAKPELSKTPLGHGESILLVDDNENLRLTTAEALQSSGYKTHIAENGAQAVELYQSIKMDAVILDIVMPDMGGPAAARVILDKDPEARLVFSTGYDKERALDETDGLESIPVLSKPFEIDTLLKTLRQLLD